MLSLHLGTFCSATLTPGETGPGVPSGSLLCPPSPPCKQTEGKLHISKDGLGEVLGAGGDPSPAPLQVMHWRWGWETRCPPPKPRPQNDSHGEAREGHPSHLCQVPPLSPKGSAAGGQDKHRELRHRRTFPGCGRRHLPPCRVHTHLPRMQLTGPAGLKQLPAPGWAEVPPVSQIASLGVPSSLLRFRPQSSTIRRDTEKRMSSLCRSPPNGSVREDTNRHSNRALWEPAVATAPGPTPATRLSSPHQLQDLVGR
nr:uncharacterized protein LOC105858247 [Microcebus murinus]